MFFNNYLKFLFIIFGLYAKNCTYHKVVSCCGAKNIYKPSQYKCNQQMHMLLFIFRRRNKNTVGKCHPQPLCATSLIVVYRLLIRF